ncbi:hypothetical protein HanIR_Chr08g0385251 [Helianthus annuus]|nr:hypothetical protein HanIR_Chr08g0385251 [Helianthus annuus]
MTEIIECFSRKQVHRADLPKHAPPRTVRCEHEILIIIRNMLRTRVRRSARKVPVMSLQKFRSN